MESLEIVDFKGSSLALDRLASYKDKSTLESFGELPYLFGPDAGETVF